MGNKFTTTIMFMRRSLPLLGVSVLVLAALGFLPPSALADRGMIPIEPGVSVYEPGQKAIVAWHEGQEVLILSTDVRGSAEAEAKVLEILPLPSPPKIEGGEFSSFETIQRLIYEHMPPPPVEDRKALSPGFELLFHERIGAHELTVVRATGYRELVRWIEDFLGGLRVALPAELEPLIRDYLAGGINYFVFDIIELTGEERSVEPLIYRFESPWPYFPLRISRVIPGETEIQLFLITQERPQGMEGYIEPLKPAYYHLLPSGEALSPIQFALTPEELEAIDPRVRALFPGEAWLTAFVYYGPLDGLVDDFVLPLETEASVSISAEIEIFPPLPTPRDEVEVRVTYKFSPPLPTPCHARFPPLVREDHTFRATVEVGPPPPGVYCIQVIAPLLIRTYHLGRLEVGSYRFEVVQSLGPLLPAFILIASREFEVVPEGRVILFAGEGSAAVGETVAIPIGLTAAPRGLSRYEIAVSLGNPGVARIEGVSFALFDNLQKRVELLPGGDVVIFSGVDLRGEVSPGDERRNITLAFIRLRALARGESAIQVEVREMVDDHGDPLHPATRDGELTVKWRYCYLDGHTYQDLDGDGLCEDLNNNSQLDFDDAVQLALHIDQLALAGGEQYFDFNGNGRLDFDDAVQLALMAGGANAAQRLRQLFERAALSISSILAYPNPARSGDSIRFTVEGQGIAEVKVDIFNLSGTLVYSSGFVPGPGRELTWNLLDGKGEALASGVYLYIVTVRGWDGASQRSRIGKLIVLR